MCVGYLIVQPIFDAARGYWQHFSIYINEQNQRIYCSVWSLISFPKAFESIIFGLYGTT